jgi:hypothetical protein
MTEANEASIYLLDLTHGGRGDWFPSLAYWHLSKSPLNEFLFVIASIPCRPVGGLSQLVKRPSPTKEQALRHLAPA